MGSYRHTHMRQVDCYTATNAHAPHTNPCDAPPPSVAPCCPQPLLFTPSQPLTLRVRAPLSAYLFAVLGETVGERGVGKKYHRVRARAGVADTIERHEALRIDGAIASQHLA